MGEFIIGIMDSIYQHKIIILVSGMVCADTMFGFFRALKQHSFNSSFGIDGAIRKVTMLLSLMFLVLLDATVHINLMSVAPKEIVALIGLHAVGTTEFFGILYAAYESVSILKNLTLCGLPVKKMEENLRKFLGKYTDELPAELGGDVNG